MPQRTQLFQLLPWQGGLNSSLDESLIPANQLTVADNLVFDTRGSRKLRDGIKHNWDSGSTGTDSIIGLHDFWYGTSSRTQRMVGVSSARTLYSYASGTRTTLTDAGTAWSGTLTTTSMTTYNNKVILCVSGSGNVVKMWTGTGDVTDLPGTPPTASICRPHLGRLWLNDKTNPDRLHYSPPSDHTIWNGVGDSGAIDIGIGDGDPEGITAIFPSFKGDLFVAKKTKLYRIVGQTPEDFQVIKVSDGIGCTSHNSVVAVGQDDVFWVSEKGVHSLQAVASYGDFTNADVSIDIQRTFNEDLDRSRMKYVWGAYLDRLNSIAFTFTETSGSNRSLTTTSVNNAVYLYNIPLKSWYRWPDLPCQSLVVSGDSDKKRFYFGTHTTRISKSLNGTKYDISTSGTNTGIKFRVETGQILLDENPYTSKAIKRFGLIYRPRGSHSLSVTIRVDDFDIPTENQLNFSQTGSADLLGSTFVLGTSTLGYRAILKSYVSTVDGFGRSVKLTVSMNQVGAEVEIQGFFIEFEPAGTVSEVFLR